MRGVDFAMMSGMQNPSIRRAAGFIAGPGGDFGPRLARELNRCGERAAGASFGLLFRSISADAAGPAPDAVDRVRRLLPYARRLCLVVEEAAPGTPEETAAAAFEETLSSEADRRGIPVVRMRVPAGASAAELDEAAARAARTARAAERVPARIVS